MHSGKFEKYNYGSSEANRQHYNQVCDGRRKEGRVGRGGDGGEGRRKLLQCRLRRCSSTEGGGTLLPSLIKA